MREFSEIMAVLETASALGWRMLPDGTQLIGRVPHVAPEAWLHQVFRPLSPEEIAQLERRLRRPVPQDYRELLLSANGLGVFSDSLSLDGLRKNYARTGDDRWQPYSIETPNVFERPRDAEEDCFFIGGYRYDGSLLYLRGKEVFRCARRSAKPLNHWAGLWDMLAREVLRLASLFDAHGRKLAPKVPTTPPS